MLLKFGEKSLHPCGHFSKFKMAAAAILDFSKMSFLTQGINTKFVPGICFLKFGEKCFIHAEIITIY